MNRAPVKRDIILRPLDMPEMRGRIEIIHEPYVSRYAHRDGESPLDAHNRGVGYAGPKMADKGLKDGSCNRTACQLPLLGEPQWTMPSYGNGGTDGKYYYCGECAQKFSEADRDMGQPLRCTLVE